MICYVSLHHLTLNPIPPLPLKFSTTNIPKNITLLNVAGTPQSPARTATYMYFGARGASGPPRISLPNPEGDDKKRTSVGCMKGPFTTGLNGADGKIPGWDLQLRMWRGIRRGILWISILILLVWGL